MTAEKIVTPSILLLILLVGFPQISETIYTPSLPALADDLKTTASLVEFTLSIYFIGFAIGVFLWGILCDRIGRKPSMLFGLALYTIASGACYFSTDITALLFWRVFQGLGAASGSIVIQTVLRDVFHGAQRSQVFAVISGVLALSPAIGPLIGGFAAQYFGWRSNFLILVIMGIGLAIYAKISLQETRPDHLKLRTSKDFIDVAKKMIRDKRILCLAFLIGGTNGIIFSFFAEGPFIFIEILKYEASTYGLIGLVISAATIIGSVLSHRANRHFSAEQIIIRGLITVFAGALLLTLGSGYIAANTVLLGTILAVVCLFIIFLGIALVIPNTLSVALKDYTQAVGTAGAIFGAVYYLLITLFTALMSLIHNGTAVPMSLLFLSLAASMCVIFWRFGFSGSMEQHR